MGRDRKHLDSPEQNALRREFAKLYEVSGWNQVQCAVQLNMTQGYVSKILNDEVAIEPATISHFKVRLAASHPEFRGTAERKGLDEGGAEMSLGPEKAIGKEKRTELAELRESFDELVRTEPEKALSLTEVISYLRWGKKNKKRGK